MSNLARCLTLTSAIGAGVVGGVFFAFSTFVMQGLRRLPDAEGLAAMQAVNKAAPTPLFMTVLLGTALLCLGLGASSLTQLDEPSAWYQLAGSAMYLAAILLTVLYHVPRNDALARVAPGSAGAAEAWRAYARSWTTMNHLRTITSLGAAAAFVLALRAD